ncbi:glycosyl transferase family 17 protein [Metarhizium album ARSEF 1941]|uniref:Glycosyl transferase family 17 protein n=1 Tax=Metarhizium album (strain ARSEF 1941) TaxID=1081103 RepID=A0A0B2WRT0_METAS|nr:glycosyl transferase family 17 protein [Metarhizium album ARSEF 1941]KHN96207.1 glycosyl transferase family 17 protein [Metarhizium album ARSEF 1941]
MLTRRAFRVAPLLFAGAVCWIFLRILSEHDIYATPQTAWSLSRQSLLPSPDASTDNTWLVSDHLEATRQHCASHGFKPFVPSPAGRRKVYDLFMINSELDFLEIRLDTLHGHVDYFVIVESPLTFQGGKKNLTIRDNWSKFERFHSKLIYHQLEFPPHFDPRLTWDFEDLQRDAMFTQVFPKLTGDQAPNQGDVIVIADVDEIPRPETITTLRSCTFPPRLTLQSKFYYYSFQFLHVGPEWPHPQATFYQGPDETITPSHLRVGDGGSFFRREFFEKRSLKNASWHCSSCFATIDQFLNKMASFSHIWMNDPKFRNRERIVESVRHGKDFWGRKTERFVRVDRNTDVPGLLALEEGRRFGYMMNRDGDSAGFTDYP